MGFALEFERLSDDLDHEMTSYNKYIGHLYKIKPD